MGNYRNHGRRNHVTNAFRIILFSMILAGFCFSYAWASNQEISRVHFSFADLSEKLSPAVVNISTTKTVKTQPFPGGNMPFGPFGNDDFFRRFFGDRPEREFRQSSLGSGFIISADGYIFTNNHVVERADKIKVKLADGREYDGEVKGKDASTDIALIKINPSAPLTPVKFGDSDEIRPGDWVFAIGNPFGLNHTVTAGIISAKGRVIGSGPYDNFLQTDASINPGNSGGPLFNLKGEVVGINTAIVAQGQGIGFAIPINTAKGFLPDLQGKGFVTRGWLGVTTQDLTVDIAKNLKLKEAKGALVSHVIEGDPAAKGGIQAGDVILAIDRKAINDSRDLLMTVASLPVGARVNIKIWRDGKEMVRTTVVAERKDGREQKESEEQDSLSELVGMTVQEMTPEMTKHFKLPAKTGVIITSMGAGGSAENAGLRVRDIILEINRRAITSLEDYVSIMSGETEGGVYLLRIKRNETFLYVTLTVTEKKKP